MKSGKSMVNNELLLKLLVSDHEQEVVNILQEAGYWDSTDAWRDLGDKPDNHGTVNNQHKNPIGALAEKITNSTDNPLCIL